MRWLFSLGLPLVLVALGWMSQPFLEPLTGALLQIRQQAPYAVTLLAIVLAASFNQSRLFFSLLVFGVFTALLSGDAARYFYLISPATRTTAELVAVLMPLTLLVFAVTKERGIFTLRGGSRMVFIGLEVVAIGYFTFTPLPEPIGWVGKDYLIFPGLPTTAIPQLGLVMMAAAFLVIISMMIRRGTRANA